MTDYYKVLGVTAQASEKDIKSAYRKLAKIYHPDVVGEDPQKKKRMYEIQEAYRVLSDPTERSAYDEGRSVQGAQGVRRKPGDGTKRRGSTGQTASQGGPMPDMSQFEHFFGFQPGKGMGTYQDKKDSKEKTKGPINPEEMFASFFGKMKR